MDVSPQALVVTGMLAVAALYARMLRREQPVVAALPEGLAVGERMLPWAAVRGVGMAAGERGAELRIETSHGLIHARDVQLLDRVEDVAADVVRHARLAPAEPGQTRIPRDLPRGMRSVWFEWVADPSARQDPTAGQARGPEHAAPSGPDDPAPAEPARRRPWRTRRPARPPEAPTPTADGKKAAAGVAVILALLLKFAKLGGAALAWGAKALKLGTFLPTAASMALSVWAYAQLWGWRFAAGLVGLLFVHELGHAGVMAAKGLRTSPIVFIPGLGALIALKDQFLDARVEAQTGWGGPAIGALGAAACYLVWAQTGESFWLGLAFTGCLLNLFNLLPVSPLDGGRIVTAISPWLWVPGVAIAGWLGLRTGNALLMLIVLFGAMRAVREWRARRRGLNLAYFDIPAGERALLTLAYFGLCTGLGWLTHHAYTLVAQAA